MKFLLDTSFLMIPGNFGVDIFSELTKFGKPELYTLDLVIRELEMHLKEGNGKTKKSAKLALSFIERMSIEVIETKKHARKADDELFRRGNKFVICTLDRAIAKNIKEHGGKVVILRQKKYLETG